MSFRNVLNVFILMFGLFSCNQSGKTTKESLVVTLDLYIYKNDTIQLFYVTNTDDSYTETLSIKQFVEAKDNLQTLRYEIPADIKPKNIRIDLGEQADYHDSIRIQNITFRYKDLFLDGSNGEYKKWFEPNKNIYFQKDSLVYKMKIQDNFYDPQLHGNKILNAKLVKLFPPNIYER